MTDRDREEEAQDDARRCCDEADDRSLRGDMERAERLAQEIASMTHHRRDGWCNANGDAHICPLYRDSKALIAAEFAAVRGSLKSEGES